MFDTLFFVSNAITDEDIVHIHAMRPTVLNLPIIGTVSNIQYLSNLFFVKDFNPFVLQSQSLSHFVWRNKTNCNITHNAGIWVHQPSLEQHNFANSMEGYFSATWKPPESNLCESCIKNWSQWMLGWLEGSLRSCRML
jgi:hypothetical protein